MLMQQSTVHRKYHGNTGYLLRNIDTGIHGNGIPCGQHADDVSNQVTVDDITWKSHETIAQINRTNESQKTR